MSEEKKEKKLSTDKLFFYEAMARALIDSRGNRTKAYCKVANISNYEVMANSDKARIRKAAERIVTDSRFQDILKSFQTKWEEELKFMRREAMIQLFDNGLTAEKVSESTAALTNFLAQTKETELEGELRNGADGRVVTFRIRDTSGVVRTFNDKYPELTAGLDDDSGSPEREN